MSPFQVWPGADISAVTAPTSLSGGSLYQGPMSAYAARYATTPNTIGAIRASAWRHPAPRMASNARASAAATAANTPLLSNATTQTNVAANINRFRHRPVVRWTANNTRAAGRTRLNTITRDHS